MTKEKAKHDQLHRLHRRIHQLTGVLLIYCVVLVIAVAIEYIHAHHYETVYYPLLVGWDVSIFVQSVAVVLIGLSIGWFLLLSWMLDTVYKLWDKRYRRGRARIVVTGVIWVIVSYWGLFNWATNALISFNHIETIQFDDQIYQVTERVDPFYQCTGSIYCGDRMGRVDLLLYECDEAGNFCALVHEEIDIWWEYWVSWEHDPANRQIIIQLDTDRDYYWDIDPIVYTYADDER